MSKAQEFRDQSVDELKALLHEKERERFQILNKRQKEKKLDKPHLLQAARKSIARIHSVLSEKERAK